ncbi:MAG: DUF2240 family protein, partial [Nanoarchaeota archaeon]
MMRLSVPEIIGKIQQNTTLSEQDIKGRISQKLNQLSNLISEEGAAHIVANELGVKIFEVPKDPKIKDLISGMK